MAGKQQNHVMYTWIYKVSQVWGKRVELSLYDFTSVIEPKLSSLIYNYENENAPKFWLLIN